MVWGDCVIQKKIRLGLGAEGAYLHRIDTARSDVFVCKRWPGPDHLLVCSEREKFREDFVKTDYGPTTPLCEKLREVFGF
jgi:hypothetical protein